MLPALFEKHNSFLRPLKKKGFKEERVTTIGWYDIGKSHDPGIQQEPAKKHVLFEQVRHGAVRILLGSTQKMGTGTNVQKRLVALHHLDAPWKPAEVEQRDGRILRCPFTHNMARLPRYASNTILPCYASHRAGRCVERGSHLAYPYSVI
jgi:hypothetical protein